MTCQMQITTCSNPVTAKFIIMLAPTSMQLVPRDNDTCYNKSTELLAIFECTVLTLQHPPDPGFSRPMNEVINMI